MNYNIETTPNFDKELKYLVRKYRSLKDEMAILLEKLTENPFMGIDMGNNVRKIRLAVQSKNKGKSGGVRVMTYLKIEAEHLYLFSIYSKGEYDTISEQKIDDLLEEIDDELE
jgi:mRNA-degrading endonuclease RelE of RelBE toxin-antitoxin system